MKLTPKKLSELEKSLWTFLTREQRAIMLCWYGTEGRYGWEEEDFVHGFHKVLRYYPDHRVKEKAFPGIAVNNNPLTTNLFDTLL